MTTDEPQRELRFSLSTLLLVMLSVALVLASLQRFAAVALRVEGILAGTMLLFIGGAVGRIIGSQPGPRMALIFVGSTFFIGLANGLIRDFGDDLTMWSFLCMTAGLSVGASSTNATSEVKASEYVE